MDTDLTIDFTKLFPLSCAAKGITNLHAKVSEIKQFKRTRIPEIGFAGESRIEDFIQIGDTAYRFPALDNGIMLLSSLAIAQNVLTVFEMNKDLALSEFDKIKRDAALITYKKFTLEYS